MDTDGTILSPDEAHAVMLERCPTCGPDGDDGWVWANLPDAWRIAPVDSYDTFVAAEALTWSVIGLACIVLTFPVAAWHRPRPKTATARRSRGRRDVMPVPRGLGDVLPLGGGLAIISDEVRSNEGWSFDRHHDVGPRTSSTPR